MTTTDKLEPIKFTVNLPKEGNKMIDVPKLFSEIVEDRNEEIGIQILIEKTGMSEKDAKHFLPYANKLADEMISELNKKHMTTTDKLIEWPTLYSYDGIACFCPLWSWDDDTNCPHDRETRVEIAGSKARWCQSTPDENDEDCVEYLKKMDPQCRTALMEWKEGGK